MVSYHTSFALQTGYPGHHHYTQASGKHSSEKFYLKKNRDDLEGQNKSNAAAGHSLLTDSIPNFLPFL